MRTLLHAITVTIVLSGCFATKRVARHDFIAPSSAITIEFLEPQTLHGVADSAAYGVPGIRSLSGRVEYTTVSTLVIRIRELTFDPPRSDSPRPGLLAVPRGIPAQITLRRFSQERTLQLALSVTAVGLTVVAIKLVDRIDDLLKGP